MSTPKYFSNFSDVDYALRANKAGQGNFFKIKDYFQLLRVRDDIYKEDTLYDDYLVADGERPDQISYNLYGDEQWYWIILQINDIVDYYNQWPLSNYELESFVRKKYDGEAGAAAIHHWETVKTYDNDNNYILPGGMSVSQDYIYYYPSTPGSTVYLSSLPVAVSNFEYERRLNDEKSQIQVLDKKYIYDFDREVRKFNKDKQVDRFNRQQLRKSYVDPQT